jgi:hypothetical protein
VTLEELGVRADAHDLALHLAGGFAAALDVEFVPAW